MGPPEPRLGVYFLDVGQGDCTFIVAPDGTTVLVDCNDAHVARRFLEDHGIVALRAVVATHLDLDHVRGLLPLLKGWIESGRKVDRLCIGRDRFRSEVKSSASQLLEHGLEWERAKLLTLCSPFREGDPKEIARGADWSIRLVAPRYGARLSHELGAQDEPNELSAIVRVERAGEAILVGGDATLGSWESLDATELRADVVRTPHHGGDVLGGGTRWRRYQDLYDAVAPRVAVFSVGTRNRHGHPLADHMRGTGDSCSKLCTQLTPQCQSEPGSVRTRAVEHHGRVEFPYRHRVDRGARERGSEVPCAGTIGVFLDARGNLELEPPAAGWHERFVTSLSSPMCLQLTQGPSST